MNKINYPLISCLCVTREKPALLKRAISCFQNQTYPNKELVIIYDHDDLATKDELKLVVDPTISIYEVRKTKEITLGFLRNYAIHKSKGEYVCQWDDDDWYHIGRIEYQYEVIQMSNYPAVILTQWLIFDSTTNKAYISHRRLWEGSLLCKKSAISNIKYDHLNLGEDTTFIEKLNNENRIYYIDNVPNLYIYTYHGKNTWNYKHWNDIFKQCQVMNPSISTLIEKILNDKKNMEENSLKLDKILDNAIFK